MSSLGGLPLLKGKCWKGYPKLSSTTNERFEEPAGDPDDKKGEENKKKDKKRDEDPKRKLERKDEEKRHGR